jgi:hypothetical protein
VREKCNVEITNDNIASRCKTFDKHYEVISKILSQSGFGWDWENNKLLIDSGDVWNRYVEVCMCFLFLFVESLFIMKSGVY